MTAFQKNQNRKIILKEWCQNTTCHGVVDFCRSAHYSSRAFWAVLMLACGGLAIYQIHGLVSNFIEEPHYLTKTYLIKENYSEFPNITVCNQNRINMTKANEWGLTPEAISFLYLSQMVMYDISTVEAVNGVSPRPLIVEEMEKERQAWEEFWPRANLTDPAEIYLQLGHTCEITFGTCQFNKVHFNCCENTVPTLNSEFGLCWTLTPPIFPPNHLKDRPVQSFPGTMHGLKLFMSPSLEAYPKENPPVFNNYLEEGLIVSPNFDPYSYWILDRVTVSPSTHVNINLENVVTRDKKPQFPLFPRQCVENAHTKHTKGEYTYGNCVADCYQQFALDNCGCFLLAAVKNKSHPTCGPVDIIDCYYPRLKDFCPVLTQCMICEEPCDDRQTVKMTTSVGMGYPAKVYTQAMRKFYQQSSNTLNNSANITEEQVRQWSVVDLYYTTRGHTVVESQAKLPVFELIANVGGQLGLWLGVSIITVAQALYYILLFLLAGLKASKMNTFDSYSLTRSTRSNSI